MSKDSASVFLPEKSRLSRDPDRLIRYPARLDASRLAFNAICQATGADHLRKAMNDIDQEVIKTSQFDDVKLILTVHDSIIYEAPREKAEAFARAAEVVMSRRPDWATIDFPVDVEIGRNLGEISPLRPTSTSLRRRPYSCSRALGWMHRLWKRAPVCVRTRDRVPSDALPKLLKDIEKTI
jgi:hypothetical protein